MEMRSAIAGSCWANAVRLISRGRAPAAIVLEVRAFDDGFPRICHKRTGCFVLVAMNSQSKVPVPTRLKSRAGAAFVYQALSVLQHTANKTSLEKPLLELVKARASQINRCGFCLELHARVATAAGESAERLHLLPAWEEVEHYSLRERAALRWTEALTALANETVSDEIFAEVSEVFSETELLELTLQVIAINAWNRLNVGFRIPPDRSFWPVGTRLNAAHPADADLASAGITGTVSS